MLNYLLILLSSLACFAQTPIAQNNLQESAKQKTINKSSGVGYEATMAIMNMRKNGCGNFSKDTCPKDRCVVWTDCNGNKFCYDSQPNDNHKCGGASYYGQKVNCCEGLVRRCPGYSVTPTALNTKTYQVAYCLKCGDGKCESQENKKNCPEDCP